MSSDPDVLEELKGRLDRIDTKLRKFPGEQEGSPLRDSFSSPGLSGTYYSGVYRTGGTYTANEDWSPQFDDPTVTTRFDFEIPSTSGYVAMVRASGEACRLMVAIDVESSVDLNVRLVVAGAHVQLKLNDWFQEYSATASVVLQLRARRRNILSIMGASGADFELIGRLWDGEVQFWVSPEDPNDLTRKRRANGTFENVDVVRPSTATAGPPM